MRAYFVVMATPTFDDRLGLRSRPKPLQAQALVAELAIEALADAIPPSLAGLDQRGVDALRDDPGQQCLRHELRAVSLRRNVGAPRSLTRRENTSITCGDRMRPSTSIASPSGELVRHGRALELLAIGAMVE